MIPMIQYEEQFLKFKVRSLIVNKTQQVKDLFQMQVMYYMSIHFHNNLH